MTITSAVEVIKLIAPVAARMVKAERLSGSYLELFRDFRHRESDILRLISLMYAVSMETVVSWVTQDTSKKARSRIAVDLIHEGFRSNSLLGLVVAGRALGFIVDKEVDEWLKAIR